MFENSEGDTIKQSVIDDISNHWCNKVIVRTEIKAGDDEHAEDKALTVCRNAIDAINFFADLLTSRDMKACVSLVGEGNEVVRPSEPKHSIKTLTMMREQYDDSEATLTVDGKEVAEKRWAQRPKGPLKGLALPRLKSRNPNGPVDEVYARVSEILGKENPSSLEERILSAFQWAGRATVDVRNEEAFLLYMISLESLLLGGTNESELTFRLSLKAAHLIGRTCDVRKTVVARLGALYKIRSQIVHSGRFSVTESEVLEARHYAKQALLAVLHAKPFRDMTTEDQLERWFEERLISSVDDATVGGSDPVDRETEEPFGGSSETGSPSLPPT
jgi:hypothetical protein